MIAAKKELFSYVWAFVKDFALLYVLRVRPYCVTIQKKAMEQCFHVVLFIKLHT